MAHSKSAIKRWRQNAKRRERNKPVRTSARTAVKKARTAIGSGADDAAAAVREASSIVDRAAKRNVIHRNTAARHKSRLMRMMHRAEAGTTAAAPKRGRKTATKKTAARKTSSRASKTKS